jgi:hypothetical protein
MSIVLPNGNTLHVTNVEELKAIAEQIEKGEPIVVRAEVGGVIEETIVWEPEPIGERPEASRRRGSQGSSTE